MKDRIASVFRYLFRYKLISIFFIVSQLVVYSAVFGALAIYNRAYDKELDKLDGIYKNRISMDVTTISDRDILTYAGMDMEQGNLIIAGKLSLAFLEQGANNRSEVIIKNNEEMPYPMISGRLPGGENGDVGKRLVAVGRGKLQYAYEENGRKYITIESESYEIVGVIGSERSDYWDYKLVFNMSCIGENVYETLVRTGSYTLELASNKEDLEKAYTEVYNNIKSVEGSAVIESKKMNSLGDNYVAKSLETESMKTNVLVYIFCIFNCMLMSEFWIIQRRKEIAVRKVCGMSDKQILLEMAGNMLSLCAVALVLFLVGSVCINLLTGTEIIIIMRPITVLGVALAMILIISLSMGYPIYKIMRMEPVRVLGNGD